MILEVEGLEVCYGKSTAVHGVDLQVADGEVAALLGRNGSGRSTTLKAIMGMVTPKEGRIRFAGQDITGAEPYRIARAGIGFVPEDRRIFADLTVWENLDVASRNARNAGWRSRQPSRSGHPRLEPDSHRSLQWTVERVFDLFPKLRDLTSRNGGFLSGGEQQMLTIARTLMGNPELLLLDEPSEGLAPMVVDHLREQIARLKHEGLTILLAEQNVEFSLALADRVYVLEKGSIRFSGPAGQLRDDEALRHDLLAL
jgi:branched-chain amino acid transport system ATP-binding protein